MRLSDIIHDSVVDGEGLRTVVFFQGCSIHCPGCHNETLQDPTGGTSITPEELLERIRHNGKVNQRLTLSGGEPLEQDHKELLRFLKLFKKECKKQGVKPSIWLYSGRHYDFDSLNEKHLKEILSMCEVLVDGPFVLSKKKELPFRGSSNQRVIDLAKTFANESVTCKRPRKKR
jgi:anaerobic ribonucleoside-triphosphate reductase activating protein